MDDRFSLIAQTQHERELFRHLDIVLSEPSKLCESQIRVRFTAGDPVLQWFSSEVARKVGICPFTVEVVMGIRMLPPLPPLESASHREFVAGVVNQVGYLIF